MLHRWIYRWSCDLSVLYRSKHWFMSGNTGMLPWIYQMIYLCYMQTWMSGYGIQQMLYKCWSWEWCLECILLRMHTFIEHQVWSGDPRKLKFAFAAIELWSRSKWNMVEHASNFVIHKCVAWSKMKEFENYLELSKALNQTRSSLNHSASYDLQTKHWPNNASAWVLCH